MKKIFAIILALFVFAISADARTIGRSSNIVKPTNFGTVRSTPTPRPIVPSYQSAPRQYTPSYTPRPAAPAPAYQPQQQQRSGPGWGHVGAFAAGAATGALNNELPYASFYEDQASLGGILTCVGVLVPESIYGLRGTDYEITFDGYQDDYDFTKLIITSEFAQ